MNKKYKYIFFDLDNTLWDFKRNSFEALKITFSKYQLGNWVKDYNLFYQVYSQFNENYWAAYRDKQITKQELIFRRFQDTFDHFGIEGVDTIQFNGDYLDIMPSQKLLVDGAEYVLDYLKGKGYKLYIITNGFHEVQHRKMETSGLKNYFDKVFISEDVKSPKPNREIFDYALKSTNSTKKQSLMIGDSWDSDIIGAMQVGMDQVYYMGENNKEPALAEDKKEPSKKNQTIIIENLAQLKDFL